MAGGISDITLTSLLLADAETVSAATAAARARVAATATTVSGGFSGQTAVDALTAGLTSRLTRFETALSRFVWPSDASTPFKARLVLRDSGLDTAVAARTADSGQAVNPAKYFSAGKSAIAASGIAPGTYCFTVAQGLTDSRLTVTVGAKDTWGTVLDKVATAINSAGNLSAQASVVRQQTPFTLDPSLVAVGSVLAVTVNPLRRDQNVTLADTSGDLLSQLGLTAAPAVVDPAAPAVYQLSVDRLAQTARLHTNAYDPNAPTTLAMGLHTFSYAIGPGDQPTSYVSTARDPTAATTLSPGTYTFGLRLGGQSRQLSVTVKSGWTWNDVENAVAAQINARPDTAWAANGQTTELIAAPSFSLPGVNATIQTAALPVGDATAGTTAARVLTVATTSGYAGETLSLTDGSGGILSALGLTTPLRGQVVSVAVAADDTWGDVLKKVAQSLPMHATQVSGQTNATLVPSAAVPDKMLSMLGLVADLTLLNRKLGQSLTLTDGATGMLATLGLNVKLPGQDGQITVNGQAMASENNTYALQSGRLDLTARADTGTTLPLAVTRSMERVQSRLGDIVTAYNDLRSYLTANSGYVSPTLSERLKSPVDANWTGLVGLGFSQTRRNALLWIATDTFWHGLYTNADAATATLASAPSGLIPAWKSAVAGIKAAGPASFLTPETANLGRIATRRTASDLERTNWLVDLLG